MGFLFLVFSNIWAFLFLVAVIYLKLISRKGVSEWTR